MVASMKIMILIICLVSSLRQWTDAELFSATVAMEPLLDTQQRTEQSLQAYVQNEMKRLNGLEMILKRLRKGHEMATEAITNYFDNPVYLFTLMIKLYTDIDAIENARSERQYTKSRQALYPSLEDLYGAAKAIARIQLTYRLNVTELSHGVLNSCFGDDNNPYIEFFNPMSVSDCFELGRTLHKDRQYETGMLWMLEALRKFYHSEDNESYYSSMLDLILHIRNAYHLQGDFKNALKWTKGIIALTKSENLQVKEHTRLAEQYQLGVDKDELKKRRNQTIARILTQKINKSSSLTDFDIICHDGMNIPLEIKQKLKCYRTESHPFLILAPVKTEQLYLEPDVVMFYDVMSDKDIKHILDISKRKLKRVNVRNTNTGKISPSANLIGQTTSFEDEESDIFAKISRRISHITGLSIKTAEALRVANYGIGGQFKPHYDFNRKSEMGPKGNVIATVLFYLSDVTQGGATVFPALGLSVFPVKRAALFWMNLLPTGEGDKTTRHAACPVLRGSKWVSNKWLYENGQELLKSCNINYKERSNSAKLVSSSVSSSTEELVIYKRGV